MDPTMDTSCITIESLDDNTPLPELSFEDFLEPTQDETATQHHMEIDALDSDEDGASGEEHSISINESLNTPQFKRSVVTILEDKRLRTPGPAVLKSHAIKVVTEGAGAVAPVKPQITDIKILKNFKPVSSNTIKIGNTTVAPTSSPGETAKGMPLNSLTMTQIKTPDGKVLYLQRSLSAGAAAKQPVVTASTPTTSKAAVTVSSGGAVHHLVAPAGLQKAILSKAVNVGSTGLVKAAVPGKGGTSGTTPVTIKGITPLAAKGVPSSASSPTSTPSAKFQVVRSSDGKIIKIKQASSSMIINSKATTTTTPGAGNNAAASALKMSLTAGNMGLRKSIGQVVIKAAPPKQAQRDVSNTSTLNTTTTGTSGSSAPSGKMLVQSTGKQIVVSSKNIIKLSPKAGATSSITNTSVSQGSSPTKGIHAVQIPGKGGVVQYVRVLPNTKEAANSSSTSTSAKTSSTSKVTFVRSIMPANASTSSPTNASSAATKSQSVGNTNKIIMKTTGGSIVPLPSMQTLVSKRALGATNTRSPGSNSGNQESPRKHRLTDLNIQHLSAGDEASDSSEAGPETKKPRFVISVAQSSQQQPQHKQIVTRPSSIQRVTVQGANSNKIAPNSAKKVYNLVQSANGVKYMICNSGVPQSSTSAMRRGYTGYVDSKTRRPLSIAPMQHATNLQALQAQAKQRIRQQQLQNQPSAVQPKAAQATGQPTPGNASDNANPQSAKILPGKQLFEILKSPPSDTQPAADALAGMASRRKHCNCSKSQCLKLYCDCFANGEFCQDCTCKDCFNNLDYEVERERAIRSCLERNPSAFKPKITAPNSGDMRLHNKGCNCKRSGCLKNYCECYEAKIPCSNMCKCVGCRNMEDRPDMDMDSIDSLADGEETNKARDDKQSQDDSDRYLTDDVVEATIMCMISRIVMHEKQNTSIENTEREVMEELGESLNQIITFGKEKGDSNELVDSMDLVS